MMTSAEIPNEMAPDTVSNRNSSRRKVQVHPVIRNMKKESDRLKTFLNWTVSFLDPRELAKGGFYYTNTEDIIRCAFCDVGLGCWGEGDIPRNDHLREFPDCPLINGRDCGNIPISECEEEVESDELETGSYDVCGPYGLEIRPFSGPEKPEKNLMPINDLCKYFEDLGVSKISGPVAPYYATYESRLNTYESWKYHNIQSPEKLADAGFYSTSSEDKVLCFHCGGGLQKWKPEDQPWVEHARWFHKCGFVLLRKGKEFVYEVLSKKKAFLTASAVREILKNSPRPSGVPQLETNSTDKEKISTPNSSTSNSTSGSERSSPIQSVKLKPCRICYVRDRQIVFLPCGHFVSCTHCASSLSSCAVCRKAFEAVVRVNLNTEDKDPEVCGLCHSNGKEMVFLPCGHFVSCGQCASSVTFCGQCERPVGKLVRVYVS